MLCIGCIKRKKVLHTWTQINFVGFVILASWIIRTDFYSLHWQNWHTQKLFDSRLRFCFHIFFFIPVLYIFFSRVVRNVQMSVNLFICGAVLVIRVRNVLGSCLVLPSTFLFLLRDILDHCSSHFMNKTKFMFVYIYIICLFMIVIL